MSADKSYPPQPALLTGLKGNCPRCGHGKLFDGFLRVAPACQFCGLNLSFADSADGPAVFVTLIGGFIVLGAALWTDMRYEPPLWVHLVVFLPLTIIVCLALLRPAKATLIALQYRNKAEPGRLEH
jgi:uncharacterized protein (DUF983 family)